jgi:hypothetical protein
VNRVASKKSVNVKINNKIQQEDITTGIYCIVTLTILENIDLNAMAL